MAEAPPRPKALAAAVVLVRRAPRLEVYWVQRSDELAYLGGFHAFPGGRVDKAERERPDALLACAARETFEETGVLLLRGARRVPAARRDEWRRDVLAGHADFAKIVEGESLELRASDFVAAGRWVSPPFTPGGFDTYFYLAELPDGESPSIWPGELQAGEWITPEEGLARWRANRALLAAPVLYTLRALAGAPDATLAAWGETLSAPPEARGGDVPRIEVHPGFILVPLKTPTLAPATHTNCLIVGGRELLVVDPGSAEAGEQAKLDAALAPLLAEGRRVAGIAITHHHGDHWGGLAALRARHAVPVYAHAWTAPKVGADRPLQGGETIELAPDGDRPWRIEAIHTPGHTPGHLALYDAVSGTIAAGDLVSGLSTIVVDPPEGDMAAYVASLARLLERPATVILPGHGPPMGGPAHRLRFYLEHRAMREGKILAAVQSGASSMAAIVTQAYDDTPADRHGLAARSALAHLLKLRDEDRVSGSPEEGWRACAR
jgi:glyoxylase-like metal-dependent hydrolase (beta-lactamase superfamily II)/8-oxo-dGTP pyrophosphatase MutT (NUDIX family)